MFTVWNKAALSSNAGLLLTCENGHTSCCLLLGLQLTGQQQQRALQFNSRRFKESRQVLLSCSAPNLFPCNHLSERISSLQQPFWNVSLARTLNLFVSFVALFRVGSGIDLELDVIDYWPVAFRALLTLTGPINYSLNFFFSVTIILTHKHSINKVIRSITPNKDVKEEGEKKDLMGQKSNVSERSDGGGRVETSSSRSRQETERCWQFIDRISWFTGCSRLREWTAWFAISWDCRLPKRGPFVARNTDASASASDVSFVVKQLCLLVSLKEKVH